jgi:hypothetical protein
MPYTSESVGLAKTTLTRRFGDGPRIKLEGMEGNHLYCPLLSLFIISMVKLIFYLYAILGYLTFAYVPRLSMLGYIHVMSNT